MAEPSQQQHFFTRAGTVLPLGAAARGWVDGPDDLALGCESADPSLQIEQWVTEVLPLQTTSN